MAPVGDFTLATAGGRHAGNPAVQIVVLSNVRLHRDGLALCLADVADVDVVATAAHGRDAAAALTRNAPDVALLDLTGDDDLASARALVEWAPHIAFVLLAVPELEQAILECAEAGIAGYVTREGSIAELAGTIRRVALGEADYPPRMVARLLQRIAAGATARPSARSILTARERQVAALLEDGLANKEIARRLSIELPTVKNHVHNILDKLGASRRGEAVAKLQAEYRASPTRH